MVVDPHSEGEVQPARFEAKALVPFRIQVPMDDCTAILETTTLEFHVRVTAACVCVCLCLCVFPNSLQSFLIS